MKAIREYRFRFNASGQRFITNNHELNKNYYIISERRERCSLNWIPR